MKDDTNRRQRLGTARLALLALLLPLALASTAQTPLRWNSAQSATQVATVTTVPLARAESVPQRIAYVPPPRRTTPLAAGFDVRQFETIAQALVTDQRVPGLAMAIVKDGRILTARGYGITDVRAAEPIDAIEQLRERYPGLVDLYAAFATSDDVVVSSVSGADCSSSPMRSARTSST